MKLLLDKLPTTSDDDVGKYQILEAPVRYNLVNEVLGGMARRMSLPKLCAGAVQAQHLLKPFREYRMLFGSLLGNNCLGDGLDALRIARHTGFDQVD